MAHYGVLTKDPRLDVVLTFCERRIYELGRRGPTVNAAASRRTFWLTTRRTGQLRCTATYRTTTRAS